MVWWSWLALSALTAAEVRMDSVSDEITAGSTRQPLSDTRGGFVSNHLAADFTIDYQWVLGASYTFSLTQGVGLTHTPSVDATFLPDDHISASLAADGTPPTATQVPFCGGPQGLLCVPVKEQLWSVGGMALFSWESGRARNFEWGVDAAYSPRFYGLRYSLVTGPRAGEGISEELQQHRASIGATGHLFQVVDIDLRGAYYFYAGSLRILQAPVIQLAGGLPIAPRWFEAATNVTAFFLNRKLSAKVGFLFAPYAYRCLGNSGQLLAKVSGTLGAFRLWGSVLFQSDRPPTGTAVADSCTMELGRQLTPIFSTYASVGAEYEF